MFLAKGKKIIKNDSFLYEHCVRIIHELKPESRDQLREFCVRNGGLQMKTSQQFAGVGQFNQVTAAAIDAAYAVTAPLHKNKCTAVDEWQSEIDATKRTFIENNANPKLLTENVKTMRHPFAEDVRTKTVEVVPRTHLGSGGWPCNNTTRNAQNRGDYTSCCIELGIGKSGEGFNDYLEVLKSSNGSLLNIGENDQPLMTVSTIYVNRHG